MNDLEREVRRRWRALPWARYGRCCKCGEISYCRGKTSKRVFCLDCFDQA